MKNPGKFKGFTLMELMIAVAIIGILAGIALPQYQQYILKSKRVDAKNAIMKVGAEQEKYYLQNNTYFDNTQFGTVNTAKGWFKVNGSSEITSDGGFYKLVITQDGTNTFAQSFVVTATPSTGSPQTKDLKCTAFAMDGSGQQRATGSNVSECW
jgi:type IV pilus assembly protein PilE